MRHGPDLENEYLFGQSLIEGAASATANGDSVDCRDTVAEFTVVALVNALNSGSDATVDIKIQSSPDDSNWTDISGATMTQVAGPVTFAEAKTFATRDARYLRAVATLAGSSLDVDLSVGILAGYASN
jgi:hypothetical protein